jgi:hypothetical protein
MAVKHSYTSPVTDQNNTDEVGPTDWNADHVVNTGIIFPEQGSNPSTPSSTNRTLFAKSTGFYEIDSNGNVTRLGINVGTGASVTVVGTGSTSSSTTMQISAPGSIASGDLIILAGNTTNNTPNASGPTGTGWVELLRNDTSSSEFQFLYYKISNGTETTFEMTASAATDSMASIVLRGVDTLWSYAFIDNSLAAPAAVGHPYGIDMRIYFQTNNGTMDYPLGDAYTQDVYVNAGGSYSEQVAICHRLCVASFDVPEVGATGVSGTYAGAVTLVWYAS